MNTSLIYRIKTNEIELVAFIDNRSAAKFFMNVNYCQYALCITLFE